MQETHIVHDQYDYVIIGSGFGGSVSALRLSEKGYKVLVVEKGKWYTADDFAKSTWQLKRWIWQPQLGLQGIMKLTILRHVTILSGVGVGGGSLVYGATLPTPKDSFFETGSWAGLVDWKNELAPHYSTALTMLGAVQNPTFTPADGVMKQLANDIGKADKFEASRVGIYFGDTPDTFSTQTKTASITNAIPTVNITSANTKTAADPYFNGEGPKRSACTQCGGCMQGCRHNAKNSLDKNYLYLAHSKGTHITAETEVTDVTTAGATDGSEGYFVTLKPHLSKKGQPTRVIFAKGVVFSGGVTGTVPLLLKLKQTGSLPKLSPALGRDIRTNNESLTSVTSLKNDKNFAQGVCIGSIINTDEHSHLEPINYSKNSGAWRMMVMPVTKGSNILTRLLGVLFAVLMAPLAYMRTYFKNNWGDRTIYLLFMQHLDSTLDVSYSRLMGFKSKTPKGKVAPSAKIPAANELTKKVEKIIGGKATRSTPEVLLGTPSTAHVLGGCVMGPDVKTGVIDQYNRVYRYQNMLVCDGSAISANPGVNPSLSITAVTEWAMAHVAAKDETLISAKTTLNLSTENSLIKETPRQTVLA